MIERRSLKQTLSILWLSTGAIALVLSFGVFLGVGLINATQRANRIDADLSEKARYVARRVSAELLLGQRGAIPTVVEQLKAEYGLKSIQVKKGDIDCADHCFSKGNSLATVSIRAPMVQDPTVVDVSASAPGLLEEFSLSLALAAVAPVALVLLLGLYLQRRFLNRFLIRPIQTLSNRAVQGDEIPNHWPKELSDLSHDLEVTLQKRDQALIGQVASGILHDIKTQVHSIAVATDLTTEKVGSEKFVSRLENLYRVCSQQVPKMRAVIESVLDGNRSIQVTPKNLSIKTTIEESLKDVSDVARGLNVEFNADLEEVIVAHDPVQFGRVMGNLLRNAVESIQVSEKGKGAVKVSLKTQGSGVSVAVEDDGPGLKVSPDRVFKSVRSTKPHGIGIGLVVSKKIVEAHGGQIAAGPSSLGGAQFSVYLPFGGDA